MERLLCEQSLLFICGTGTISLKNGQWFQDVVAMIAVFSARVRDGQQFSGLVVPILIQLKKYGKG